MNKKYFNKTFFSGFVLKLISTILFVAGRVLLELDFVNAGAMYIAGNIMTYTALPIICFLAVEGYRFTHNSVHYLVRLATVGIVTELIIDYALFGKAFSKYLSGNNLNLFLTLTIGVGMIALLDLIRSVYHNNPVWRNMFTIILIMIFAVAATVVGAEQGGGVIFTMAAMYLFYGNPFLILIAEAVIQIAILGSVKMIFLLYAPILGVIITWFYNGKRGYRSLASRGLFYAVYPITYVIITMVIKARG